MVSNIFKVSFYFFHVTHIQHRHTHTHTYTQTHRHTHAPRTHVNIHTETVDLMTKGGIFNALEIQCKESLYTVRTALNGVILAGSTSVRGSTMKCMIKYRKQTAGPPAPLQFGHTHEC